MFVQVVQQRRRRRISPVFLHALLVLGLLAGLPVSFAQGPASGTFRVNAPAQVATGATSSLTVVLDWQNSEPNRFISFSNVELRVDAGIEFTGTTPTTDNTCTLVSPTVVRLSRTTNFSGVNSGVLTLCTVALRASSAAGVRNLSFSPTTVTCSTWSGITINCGTASAQIQVGSSAPPPPPQAYTVRGSIQGLASAGLQLRLNRGGDPNPVFTNPLGPGVLSYDFIQALSNGTTYAVSISQQPQSQDCTLSSPSSGTISGADAIVNVACVNSAPQPTRPDPPTNVVATALDRAASVSFSPPLSNGGSAITAYRVTASNGAAQSFAGTSGTFDGLINGFSYTFRVQAQNAVGLSDLSQASNMVTPGASMMPGQDKAFDINGDGNTDMLWYNSVFGDNYYQLRSGPSVTSQGSLFVHPTWRVVTSGDLDADGRGDLLWYNSATGESYYWLMNGPSPRQQGSLFVHPLWRITHSPDLDGDGRSDLLWINPGSGETHAWMMNGATRTSAGNLFVHPMWRVTHTGDLNGDRRADLIWYNEATGESYYWLMNGMLPISQGRLLLHPTWRVVAVGDLNADGREDLLWHNRATGESYYWLMSGGSPIAQGTLFVHPSWVITGTADVNGDGRADLLWHNPASGETVLWIMSGVTPTLQLSVSTDGRWRNINQ
jgi:hypothetical protein